MYSNTNLKSSELKYLCWSKRSSVAWRCCVWRHSCFETECHLGVTWTSAVCSHKQTTALHWWPMTSAIQRLRVRDDGFRLYMRCRRLAGVQGGPTKTIPRFIFDCISWMQQWNSMIFGTYELHKKVVTLDVAMCINYTWGRLIICNESRVVLQELLTSLITFLLAVDVKFLVRHSFKYF